MNARSMRSLTRRGTVVVAAAAVLGAGALPAVAGADPVDCGGGALIAVAGTNDVGANHLIGVKQRYTGKMANGTVNPHSPYQGDNAYRVIAPTYPTELWPVGTVAYDDDVRRGTVATAQAIAEYQAECPGKPVVVAGYSQGARVAGDVLNAVGTSTSTKTVDGVTYREVVGADGESYWISADGLTGELYSDPRRDGPESGRGIEQSLLGVLPGLTMSGARAGGFGDVPVTSFCVEGDPICDLPDPLHDPIGAIDGLVGYFTKHGYYPWRMWRPVTDSGTWKCAAEPAVVQAGAGVGYVECMIPAGSAISGVRRDAVNQVRAALGLPPRDVIDFLSLRPNLNGIFPHANLSDLQWLVTPVFTLLPELPNLGYGGYLPSVLLFQDLLNGVRDLNLPAVLQSLQGIAGSVVSIAAMPLRFVEHWVGEAVELVRDGSSSTTGTETLRFASDAPTAASEAPTPLMEPAPATIDPPVVTPQVEAPAVEAPAVEAPSVETPAVEAPGVEAPAGEVPSEDEAPLDEITA